MSAVALDVFDQRRNISRNAKEHGTRGVELNVDVLENSGAPPDAARQVHRLLRRAGALDRHNRLGEQCPPPLEFLHQTASIRRELVAVVRSDAVAAERGPKPRNGLRVELDTRTRSAERRGGEEGGRTC